MKYELSYKDYVTKFPLNATILFSVGIITGFLLTKALRK